MYTFGVLVQEIKRLHQLKDEAFGLQFRGYLASQMILGKHRVRRGRIRLSQARETVFYALGDKYDVLVIFRWLLYQTED